MIRKKERRRIHHQSQCEEALGPEKNMKTLIIKLVILRFIIYYHNYMTNICYRIIYQST